MYDRDLAIEILEQIYKMISENKYPVSVHMDRSKAGSF